MNTIQKEVFKIMLAGGFAIDFSNYKMGIRVYDNCGLVIFKINYNAFRAVRQYTRLKEGKFLIDKRAIRSRSVRKNTWVKIEYRKLLNNGKNKGKTETTSI